MYAAPVRFGYVHRYYPVRPMLGQAPTPEPAPPSKPPVLLLLAGGAGGGALLGWALSVFLGPKLFRMPLKGASTYGALGGLIGGLAGVGTALLLKD